ncbi:hypothetical protein [Rhodobacter capsulatus]|uniref:hypothetical protein n=1 Tax=Rhodobacter capsulatus TaxID=1061 RepID=UPI004027054D
MSSRSRTTDASASTTSTNILDRRATQQSGLQILDSAIIGADDQVIRATLEGLRANFQVLTSSNSATVSDVMSIATRVLGFADQGQIRLETFAYNTLRQYRDTLEQMQRQGQNVLEFADAQAARAMQLAGSAQQDQSRALQEALSIVAETKTGDFSQNLTTLSALVMGFALAALYIARKN